MTDGVGYALDLYSPAQHVALEIERAVPAALSVDQLIGDYKPTFSDLSRVRLHEGFEGDKEATRWVIERAIQDLIRRGTKGAEQLVAEESPAGVAYRFADGITFDDLYFHGRKLRRPAPDVHEKFHDPFNPLHGAYSEAFGIKTARLDPRHASRQELRESLLHFGWEPELPAIKDERGVVLVGHRRLELAAELRAEGHEIEDVFRTVVLGDGDAADAKRFRLAIVSNLGSKPFTQEERGGIAEYLYGERGWTQAQIAEALNVSQTTISVDLLATDKSTKRGRPRKLTPEKEQEMAAGYLDQGKTRNEVAKAAGVSHGLADLAIAKEKVKREMTVESVEPESTSPVVVYASKDDVEKVELVHTCPSCGHQFA